MPPSIKSSRSRPTPILVDDREKKNSHGHELFSSIQHLHLPVERTRLEFGDAAFIGNGPRGKSVMVGVERKTIRDLMNSFTSKRLQSIQLPGMVETYQYRWIVVEGLWRPASDNVIEIYRGGGWRPAESRVPYHVIEQFLVAMEVNCGVWVRHTHNLRETALFLGNLYHWWGKRWEEHRSHLALEKGLAVDRLLLARPSYERTFAATIPGIGWEKSKAVVKRFGTVERMVNASEEEWRSVPGIGKKMGQAIPKLMRGAK